MATQLRPLVGRIASRSLRKVLQSHTAKGALSTTANRFRSYHGSHPDSMTNVDYSKLDVKGLQEMGVLDDGELVQFDTLHNMQVNACLAFDENDLFGTYKAAVSEKEEAQYEWMSFTEWGETVNQCRAVLQDMGVEEYARVGIISNNRWEWATVACAAFSLNATVVPMYEAQLPSDWNYILNDSGATALFCATQDIFNKCQTEVLPSTPTVKTSLCFDAPQGEPHAFATAMAQVENSNSKIVQPTPDDLANLIYTSGTTGKPKGVELTHLNFVSNIKAAVRGVTEQMPPLCHETDRSLAFLPWAHSYGQTCELWSSISHGASMGVCRGVPFILEDLQMVQPTTLFAVPTLYKRIYDGVHNLMESSSPIRKNLMKTALDLGSKKAKADAGVGQPLGIMEGLQYKVLDSIVLSKIRARFGGKLKHGFAGGAACPAEVIEFMDSLGIEICEGYGLTETAPIITLNTPTARKAGSVGRPLKGNTVYVIGEDGKPVGLGEEGEICCTGPNIMRGYWNNQKSTDEVITLAPDGVTKMFHTGDLGRLDADGFLSVTGRLKEQYKLENGKYVCPTPIEEAIGMSRFITQVVLCGANRAFNSALIVPDWAVIRSELKIDDSVSEDDLANDQRVKELVDGEIASNCKSLKKFEVPQRWAFVAPFTAANNMLTPKMSIRRHKVLEAYEDLIFHMYDDDKNVTEAADGGHSPEHHNVA
mmetsp:Transcript_26633/g.37521  ORF Transcript_26633/g.37521 Transcript_26633/m.37521 type:complete len:706 (-) Transcript_26633:170-2287(-)